MVEIAQAGALVAGAALARRSALPDAPVKESPKTVTAPVALEVAAPAARLQSGEATRAEIVSAVASSQRTSFTPQVSKTPGVTTYRDQESGRLIIRVYDKVRGDVLVEFPPENSISAGPPPGATAVSAPKQFIDA
ncbi:MAG: hypothetical protein AAF530_05120 [Pseudomonadota bacterium]